MVASMMSTHRSSGVVDPSCEECQRRRQSRTRPLIVSTVKSCRPLLRFFLPVFGSFGGGKSGFRRIHSHLQAFLEGLLAKLGEQVADLLFAARDDVSRRCVVDRVSDLAKSRLHLRPHLY